MTLTKKQKTWGIVIGIFVILAIIGNITEPEPQAQRNYSTEANQLIKKLRNPTDESRLKADYQTAETLFNEMKQLNDSSDAFILAFMELEALITYKEQNIADETKKLKIKKLFSAWDGSNPKLERYIKSQMNNPKSYEHVTTTYEVQDDKIILYTEFRGKNAYNATILNNAVAVQDLEGNILEFEFGN